jgi:hypothetical protein
VLGPFYQTGRRNTLSALISVASVCHALLEFFPPNHACRRIRVRITRIDSDHSDVRDCVARIRKQSGQLRELVEVPGLHV